MTNVDDPAKVIQERGVPEQLGSCHTATIGAYVIEGDVPVEDVLSLLDENRAITGLAAPGMPMGSPAMDMPNASWPRSDLDHQARQLVGRERRERRC